MVEKIALQFNKDIFNVGTINILATTLVDKVGNSFMHAQLWGKNMGICIVGGDLARDLDAAGGTALIDYALATMVSMFGSAVSAAFVKGNNSSWLSDPYSIGAYTYACPERLPLRTALATPSATRLSLPARHYRFLNTALCGAYDSGHAASRLVLAPLAS